jgi:hypothetical protein
MKFFLALIFTLASVTLAAPVPQDVAQPPPPRMVRPGLGGPGQQGEAFRTRIWYDAPIEAVQKEINSAIPSMCFHLIYRGCGCYSHGSEDDIST